MDMHTVLVEEEFTCKDCLHWENSKCLRSGYIDLEPAFCDSNNNICEEFHFEEDIPTRHDL